MFETYHIQRVTCSDPHLGSYLSNLPLGYADFSLSFNFMKDRFVKQDVILYI